MFEKLKYSARRLFGRASADRELDDEIRAHLEIEARQRVERGESPTQARFNAQKDFGNDLLVKEVTRDSWGWSSMEQLMQDLRISLRMLRRNPGFAAVAVLSIALGIGVTTAVFTVMDAAVLRPLPVKDPDSLVIVRSFQDGQRWIVFNPFFEEMRRRQTTLEGMAAISDSTFKVTLDGESAPVYLKGTKVSGNYFSLLGVPPAIGRLLDDNDDRQPSESGSNDCAAVIGHDFWTLRYKQETSALGRSIDVGDITCTIVGVTPRGFESHLPGYQPQIFVPLRRVTPARDLENNRMAFFSGIIGRTLPGVSRERVEAELTGMHQQLLATLPRNEHMRPIRDYTMRLLDASSGLDDVRKDYERPLTLVLIVAGIVLLIATANVANLCIARGMARASEFATRAALGAGRARLLTQLVVEGAILSVVGGALGIALAWIATPVLASFVSLSYREILLQVQPDMRVLLAALAGTVLSVLVTGLLPALRVTSGSPASAIGAGTRTAGARGSQRLVKALVGGQLALSLLLLAATGLLLRTIVSIYSIDPGFRAENVVVLDVNHEVPRAPRWSDESQEDKRARGEMYANLDRRLNAIPGVRSASVSWLNLFGGSDLWLKMLDPDNPSDRRDAHCDYVSANYFQTVGMEVVRGRDFAATDTAGSERVAVINETMAKERFGDGPALGRRLALGYQGEEDKPFRIVGIVRDSRYNDLREKKSEPMIWTPLSQTPFHIKSVSVRVEAGTQAAVLREVRRVIRETDARIMTRKETTLQDRVAQTTARESLILKLASVFGALALLLSAIGLYGTLAYAVTRRTREIGVRMALGAERGSVVRMIVGEAFGLALIAIVVGLPLAVMAGSALEMFLFGISPRDPLTLACATALLGVVVLAAAYLPARRASRVDPMVALRYE